MSRSILKKVVLLAIPASTIIAPSVAFAQAHHAGPGQSQGTASCSGTPTSVGSTWSVTGSGLPASTMVQFLVQDSSGALSSTTAMTDPNGAASVSGPAWTAGTDSVRLTDTSSKWNTLATCSFQVS